ncbi:hypothetical protein ACB092_05G105600 [Castanea dentata]
MSKSVKKEKKILLSQEPVPDDILYDILIGLPLKSLIRFRCVSKSFHSIITNPNFITANLNQAISLSNNNNTHTGYLLYTQHRSFGVKSKKELCTDVYNSNHTLTDVSRLEIPSSFGGFNNMVGFCNGTLCLADDRTSPNCKIYLWNPSIRKLNTVPADTLLDRSLDANFTHVTLGLASDSKNNDLKILRFDSFEGCPAEAQVYSLSRGSWRKIEIPMDSYGTSVTCIYPSPCLFFNGALHSLVCSEVLWSEVEVEVQAVGNEEEDSRRFILSFNVDDEKFHEIKLPENSLRKRHSECLAVLKGSLAFIGFSLADSRSGTCFIWVMKEFGVFESWTRICVPMAMDGRESLLGCTVDGELLIKRSSPLRDRIVSLDPHSSKTETLTVLSSADVIYTANFVESLVLLDG